MLKLLVTLSLVTCLWASCYDKDGERNCKSWKDTSNFCNRPDADQYCAKTCGKCNGGGGGGSGNGGSCGRSFASQGRVVNGKDAVPGAYPWIASIMMYGKHFCGATLVAPNWAVTAAHCVDFIKPHQVPYWLIKLGAHDHRQVEASTQTYNLKRIIIHPKYFINADIAMVEFYGPAKLNNRVALPCLPKKGEYPAPGKKCVVAGWGYTKYPGGVYHTLQQAELPVVKSPHKGCHNNKEAVCVGYGHGKMSDGKQYPNGCRGDSGGPLVCRRSDGRYQWEGVLSFVYSYCHSYTAYTPVNQYIDWIQSFITSKN